jgi:DNA primase
MNYYPIGTSNFFQGMHENKEAILKEKRAIIVEGLKSVMKLNGYGFGYAIASETCCLNNEQIKILLSLHLDEIIIAYDKGVKICDIINNVKKLKPFVRVSIVNDKKDIYLKDKDAPVDRGIQVWKELYEKRIFIG